MSSAPTRGATEVQGRWRGSHATAVGIRLVARSLPVFGAWLAVRLLSPLFIGVDGWTDLVLVVGQGLVVGVLASMAVNHYARRLLPLAYLFNLSLVFPDQAPSRFSVALRSGSVRRLEARIQELGPDTDRDAAVQTATEALQLVATLGCHDRLTRGHTERVRAYADLIGEELGLDPDDRMKLAWGVLLHDVGKLAVPPEILNKTGELTDEEWRTLQGHPEAGRRLLEPLGDWLGDWLLAAAEHHERWDGSGYPRGLAGDEISLAGRITAVADAYDVITSTRSYKKPMSAEAAREELLRCAGAQFDPTVVRAMLTGSLGRRFSFGSFVALVELRSLTKIVSAVSQTGATAITGGMAAIGAVATVAGPGSEPVLAFDPDPAVVVTAAPDDPADAVASGGERETTAPNTPIDDRPTPATEASAPTSGGPATATTQATGTTASTGLTTSPASSTTVATTVGGTSSSMPPTTTTSTTFSTTSTSTTTTTAPPAALLYYLTNPGTGNTSSSATLPFGLGPVDSGSLPNFDTDENSDQGLTIKKDGSGLTTSDTTKYQEWTLVFGTETAIDGTAALTVWVAATTFDTGKQIELQAALDLCNPGCSRLGVDSWSASSQAGFQAAVITFGPVTTTAPAGSTLKLRVAVGDDVGDTDAWFAYDTTAYPSRVAID